MAAFIVNNHVFVNPGYEEEFEARFKARAGEIDKQPERAVGWSNSKWW